jgi:hypothetical protein
VGGIGGQIDKEGTVAVPLDELERLVEPDVGGVAFHRLGNAVAEVSVVVEIVAEGVAHMSEDTTAVVQGLLEALVVRPQRVVVAQVPLAEHPRAVPRLREHFGDGALARRHERATHDRMPDPGACGVAPRQEG